MAQVVEDVQGLLPGDAGLLRIPRSVAGVTEVGEDLGFIKAVAAFLEQVQRPPVASGGLREAADLMLGVAEAVPGQRLAAAVAAFAVQGESPVAERSGSLWVAEQDVAPADRVKGCSLPSLIIDGLEKGQSLFSVAERVPVAGLTLADPVEGLVDAGLAIAVPELPVPSEAFSQWPRRSRKSARAQGSCQPCTSNPVSAARATAARRKSSSV
jgi:hypothetical protein